MRAFEPGDEAALLAVNATAFAHHPEQGHMTHEDFRERTERVLVRPRGPVPRGPRGRPASSLLGFHWTKVHRDEDPPYGEVYVVAVNPRPPAAGSARC